MKKIWDNIGLILGVYTVYRQLQAASQAKDELYANLSPEQKATWDKLFTTPLQSPVPQMPVSAPVATSGRVLSAAGAHWGSIPVTETVAAPITQVLART